MEFFHPIPLIILAYQISLKKPFILASFKINLAKVEQQSIKLVFLTKKLRPLKK
jgi:hypothetical protein